MSVYMQINPFIFFYMLHQMSLLTTTQITILSKTGTKYEEVNALNLLLTLTCCPSMLLYVRVQGHTVQLDGVRSPPRIPDTYCGTQSVNLIETFSQHNTPTHNSPLWSKSIPLIWLEKKYRYSWRLPNMILFGRFPPHSLLPTATVAIYPGQEILFTVW